MVMMSSKVFLAHKIQVRMEKQTEENQEGVKKGGKAKEKTTKEEKKKGEKIIMGIDPGTQVMGYGLIWVQGKKLNLI